MSSASNSEIHLTNLVQLLLATQDKELTCDELHDRVARYAEAVVDNDQLPADSEMLIQHLSICSDCREEFECLGPFSNLVSLRNFRMRFQ